MSTSHIWFIRFTKISLVSAYLVIIAGAVVRTTGSGMGCPDWPKCFGQWVPPTSATKLPEDYKEHYIQKRKDKNLDLSNYLQLLGMGKLAHRIENDPSIYEETDFNATKTWTEYVNRLFGAAFGFFLTIALVLSLFIIKKHPWLFTLSLITYIVTGFQGWFGSLVVSTNLLPGMITTHMILALVIVMLLIYTLFRARKLAGISEPVKVPKTVYWILIVTIVLSVVQIILGTQVRQEVDIISRELNYQGRSTWIDRIGDIFLVHRSFSILVLLVNGYLLYKLYFLYRSNPRILTPAVLILILLLVEIISGVIMAYFAIPSTLQPVHLVIASIMFGLQFYLLVLLKPAKKAKAIPATP